MVSGLVECGDSSVFVVKNIHVTLRKIIDVFRWPNKGVRAQCDLNFWLEPCILTSRI